MNPPDLSERMRLKQALLNAERRLEEALVPDARLDAEWLLADTLRMPRLTMLTAPDTVLRPEDRREFDERVCRRARGVPLQYVLGEAHFMGHCFYVDERVLIPRCDTETVVEAGIARIPEMGRALDIGTGSGAIAISAALSRPLARVAAVDISEDALAVARMNAERLGAAVEWIHGDLFARLSGRVFDVIVSNPPYIESGKLRTLPREVRAEPKRALDGGKDGLRFYRAIVSGLPSHLAPGGSLVFEAGDGQADAVMALLTGFSEKKMLRDLKGLPRAVIGDGYAG